MADPALIDLGRDPLLRDVTVAGGRATRIWQGQLNAAGVGIEIAEIALDQNATPARMRQVWLARRAGQARPVIVFTMLGPDPISRRMAHVWRALLRRRPNGPVSPTRHWR